GSDGDLISELERMAMEATVPEAKPAAPAEPKQAVGTLVQQTLERPLRPGEVSLDDLERAFRETEGPDSAPGKKGAAKAAKAERKPAVATADKDEADKIDSKVAAQSIRVNVETLENLMTMVSELVLTRNQLLEIVRRHEDSEFKVPLQRLSNVT